MSVSNAKVGSWLDSLLKVGTTIFGATQSGSGGGSPRVDTYGQIDSLVTQTSELERAFAAMPAAQRLQAANAALQAIQQIQAALNTIPVGNDRQAGAYLTSAKNGVAAVKTHLDQMIIEAQNGQTTQTPINTTPVNTNPTTQPTATNTTPVTLPNGQVIYVQVPQTQTISNQLINGIDNQTLAIGAGALMVAILLLKK